MCARISNAAKIVCNTFETTTKGNKQIVQTREIRWEKQYLFYFLFVIYLLGVWRKTEGRICISVWVLCVMQDYYYIIVILMRNRFFDRSILYPLSSICCRFHFLHLFSSPVFVCGIILHFFLLSYPIEFTLTYINRSGLLSPGKKIIFISAGDKMTK